MRTFLFLFLLVSALRLSAQNKYTISGYVRDSLSGETLIGSSVMIRGQAKGIITNQYGFYSITLPEGQYDVSASFAGYGATDTIIRLTTNTASIKTAINAMTAVGDTNIPMGLVWGWHTLSPNAPFSDGSAYTTQHMKKIVILMTDGENTMTNPGGSNSNGSYYSGLGYIWQGIMAGLSSGSSTSARQTAMDNRLALLCTNMKARDIVIYTVRVEVTSGTSTVLQNCASSPDKFYDVQDVSTLGAAFDSIAGSIDNLRISQ